jgi:hypothetical protein
MGRLQGARAERSWPGHGAEALSSSGAGWQFVLAYQCSYQFVSPGEPPTEFPMGKWLPNLRLKLSARWRRTCRSAQWKPSFWSAAPAGRSLSATR